ncbi:hypothetical protein [Chondrinema litorale]|uniref:hypothetical protein n=1 Tax=Chondrinema litorale TaxID=2994555 RepID=UPI0025427B5A|nr:hypothetical protein [Chondrinema litorale]UZR98527.1 hypothetical protein OQ292_31485 [Chondrinema litorale]
MRSIDSNLLVHKVFIVDDNGISTIYPRLLKLLQNVDHNNTHISLLYISPAKNYVFKEELEILMQRFPTVFITYFRPKPEQEMLETILNTNTMPNLYFYLCIDKELEIFIVDRFYFQGISPKNIQLVNRQSNNL